MGVMLLASRNENQIGIIPEWGLDLVPGRSHYLRMVKVSSHAIFIYFIFND